MEMSGWSVNVTTLIRGQALDLLSSFKTSTKVHILSPVAERETKVSDRTRYRTFYMYRVPEFRTMLTFTNYGPLKCSADLAY